MGYYSTYEGTLKVKAPKDRMDEATALVHGILDDNLYERPEIHPAEDGTLLEVDVYSSDTKWYGWSDDLTALCSRLTAMGCTAEGMIRRSGEEPDDIERADITDGHVTIRRARIVFAADDDIRRTVSGHHGTRALADAIIGLLDRE